MTIDIILASTSVYRRAILQKLGIPFRCLKEEVDEKPLPQETPFELVKRLAIAKAKAVAASERSFVIGSDQVAALQDIMLTKPHDANNAAAQLRACSGKTVRFYTGVALRHNNDIKAHVDIVEVDFHHLDDELIKNYLRKEQPFDCAGSFKSEGLGILLFRALRGNDPNSLIGLPIIKLNQLFEQYGIRLLDYAEPTSDVATNLICNDIL